MLPQCTQVWYSQRISALSCRDFLILRSCTAACDSPLMDSLQHVPGSALENQRLIQEKKYNYTFSVFLHCCRQTICRASLTVELTPSCSTSPVTHPEKQATETEDNNCVKRVQNTRVKKGSGRAEEQEFIAKGSDHAMDSPWALNNALGSCPWPRSGRTLHTTCARSKRLKGK